MQQIAIGVLVVVMMIAIGLKTDTGDFAAVLRRPGSLLGAALINVVAVPLVVLGLLALWPCPQDQAVGLLICAASPGGATGPLFASAARGHLATAVTVMIGLSLVSVFTAPLTLALALGVAVEMDAGALVAPMMGTLVVFQLLPLVVGMIARRRAPRLADRLARPAGVLANVILLAVILGLLVTKVHVLADIGVVGVLVCVALVLGNLGLGWLISRHDALRRSHVMVTGVRNISLALLISATWLPAPQTDAMILTFGLFTMVLPLLVARLWPGTPAPLLAAEGQR